MTKPLIKLPSVELREALEALNKIQDEFADKDAEIARLQQLLLKRDRYRAIAKS